jgi:hypothetical protein
MSLFSTLLSKYIDRVHKPAGVALVGLWGVSEGAAVPHGSNSVSRAVQESPTEEGNSPVGES